MIITRTVRRLLCLEPRELRKREPTCARWAVLPFLPYRFLRHLSACWFISYCLALGVVGAEESAEAPSRVSKGLVVLYDFQDKDPAWVRDRAGYGTPLDLRVGNPDQTQRQGGRLKITGEANIRSEGAANKVVAAIRRSGELTVEAWLSADGLQQAGPARVFSLSQDASRRNLTLGQDESRWEVRLRSTQTSTNGLPPLRTRDGAVKSTLAHVVFTRARTGKTAIYLNGQKLSEANAGGTLKNWDGNYRLALGDELSGGRPWRGSLHLVAMYSRQLQQKEIQQNFQAGAEGQWQVADRGQLQLDRFALDVAPILVERCSECHDALTSQGGLDLTHRKSALAGGDSGVAISPGEASNSLLIQSVLADEMPLDRSPLTEQEKQTLVDWVNSGASWGLDYVDPVLFASAAVPTTQYVQRLTREEYIATVQTTLGVDITEEARARLPKELRADGFANTAYNLKVDLKHIEAYRDLAEIIVARMDLASFIARFTQSKKFTDKEVGAFIESMGEWVLRGPLSEEEVIAFRGISTTLASSSGEFEQAAALILEAMLQSPRFVYRIENQLGDGTAWPTNETELASRISYILWGSSPDEQLFASAKRGELLDERKLSLELDRMLEDDRVRQRACQFVSQWLNLDGLANLNPNPEKFPEWDPALARDMRAETLAFFEYVALDEDRPLADLLNAPVTFVTPRLAEHYRMVGYPSLSATDENQLSQIDLSADSSRRGLLTQGSVLTIGGDEASMVTRGLFVLHNLLRGVVKDPPPCVDTTPIASEPGLTQRSIALDRISNDACGGCHERFEPLAFGLERFDGLGAYRERDEFGNPLRTDGEIVVPGRKSKQEYQSITELMDLLAQSERVRESLTWKLVQFSIGRPLTLRDARTVEAIHRRAQKHGGSYRELMKAIVLSDLVQMTPTEALGD